MSLVFTSNPDGSIVVSGNTFQHKDTIKSLGGRWDAQTRSWTIPPGSNVEELKNTTTTGTAVSEVKIQPQTRRIPCAGTFDVKELIKEKGGRWDPVNKEWIVPEDFDDSIIPRQELIVKKRPLFTCSFCHEVGHKCNNCPYTCDHCKIRGHHYSKDCPLIDRSWKRFIKSKKVACSCDHLHVCWNCKHLCCEDVEINCLQRYERRSGGAIVTCSVHNTRLEADYEHARGCDCGH
jgi:hypothetical protein